MGILLDLRKPFDTVDHQRLVKKLKLAGMDDSVLRWFTSYLSDRQQYIAHGDQASTYKNVTTGVPQGSILGPLLFIIYINDMPQVLKNLLSFLFADDTNLFAFGKRVSALADITNQDLNIVADWLKLNKLSLNANKSKCILFMSSKMKTTIPQELNPKIKIDSTTVEIISSARFLG
eukprot:Pompholyxophrys_punicea_v1_NODE_1022_length_1035_cov_1.868367.p1 type:complete len:176 gc:universal NODE_1022_length_1035_cov_1.868367:362-889(+)